MTVCPDCGTDLPDAANFCRNCGCSVGETCPACGETVSADASFCPSCGEALDVRANDRSTANDADGTGPIQLRSTELARRLDGSSLQAGGFLNRLHQKEQITIEEGTRALLLEDGTVIGQIGAGKHTLDSLGQKLTDFRTGKNRTVVLIAEGNMVLTLPIQGVRTASDFPVDVTIDLVLTIDNPEQFFTNMVADRDAVTTETLERLLGDAVRSELAATISTYDHEELYGNRELEATLRSDVAEQCRAIFEHNGLELVDLRSFEYDDDRDEIREEKKDLEIRSETEDLEDRRATLDRRERERDTDDVVHEQKQRVRRETTKQSADHEIEAQQLEHEHEKDDIQRRHRHTAEREEVEHEEYAKTTRKESEVERRELEHEQDVSEMEDLMDLKSKKDQQKLDREQREQDLEMEKEEHEVEIERERLNARDDVDLDTLVSMDGVDESVADLAEMEKAENLSPAQLEALGAQDSDELAKARQEANKAEKERERVEDQKEFREEMKEVMDGSMDRMQETTESAMDNMGETGRAAAEDTSDNVIVPDAGGSGGDTTIVQGGSGGGGTGGADGSSDGNAGSEKVVVCPGCEAEVPAENDFCTNCGENI